MKVISEIKGVGFEALPSHGLVASKMGEHLFDMRKNGMSINAIRIVLILIANLKDQQQPFLGEKGEIQYDLFIDKFLDVNDDSQYSVQLKFKFSDFLPKGSKNYNLVRKGLDELQEKNLLLTFEKKRPNGTISNFKLKSAIISSYLMEEGNGFKMVVNNFWYLALVGVKNNYNQIFRNVIFNLNYTSLTFYLYLGTLKYIKTKNDEDYNNLNLQIGGILNKSKGTKMRKSFFLEKFGIPFKFNSDIKRKCLDVWKKDLDTHSDLSFNYTLTDTYLTIITYVPAKNLIASDVVNIEEVQIKAALTYRFKKNKLDKTLLLYLLEIYLKYTYQIVCNAINRKQSLRGLEGQEYISALLILVENYVRKNRLDINQIGYSNSNEIRTNVRKSYDSL